jgi:hypothetical protein
MISAWIFIHNTCIDKCKYIIDDRGTTRGLPITDKAEMFVALFRWSSEAAGEVFLLLGQDVDNERRVWLLRSTQTSTRGGSMDTEQNALMVMPSGPA